MLSCMIFQFFSLLCVFELLPVQLLNVFLFFSFFIIFVFIFLFTPLLFFFSCCYRVQVLFFFHYAWVLKKISMYLEWFSLICRLSFTDYQENWNFTVLNCPKECGRSYKSTKTLRRHLKYECGVFPQFKCLECGRPFHQKQNMKNHVLNIHKKLFEKIK